MPTVALVGYTNAGKSTLLNALVDAHQVVKNSLFTTLDTLSKRLVLPNHQVIVVSDTVGFLYKLPHHLIEAFKATLEEVVEADLLLHVLDVSLPNCYKLSEAVYDALKELESDTKPVITVLNKIDKLSDREKQVLKLIAEGRTSQEIADILSLSIKTVMTHRTNLMEKLGMHGRADLIKYAIRRGLVRADSP